MSTKSNANQSENTRVYNNVKGNIVAVTLPKGIDGRVTISLDCEPFPSIDFETGEEIVKALLVSIFAILLIRLAKRLRLSVWLML